MDTLGKRLNYARRKKGYTQDSLAEAIGVSRGVIFNLEKDKSTPQTIVINAICKALNINKCWLMSGAGDMENKEDFIQSTRILAELYDVVKELSEDEQLFLLDIIKAAKLQLTRK